MPELPEVEILRRHLDGVLRGRRVLSVEVLRPRLVRPTGVEALRELLVGVQVRTVGRRGKHLLIEGADVPGGGGERRIVGHLGMTGRMFVDDGARELPRHAAVVLGLDQGRFVFEDPRQFGRFHADLSALDDMGPEPWDAAWTPNAFGQRISGSGRSIKELLLDQSVVAGVGNIYASEALWLAEIRPTCAGRRLKADECGRLWNAVREVLETAIELGLRAQPDFASGAGGLFYYGESGAGSGVEERFRVYDREGQPCPRCGGGIQRLVQGARSSFFCPGCQS
jgi:formamidopyrimidine-DNA glycosylase